MNAVVIDENVLVVAEKMGADEHTSDECRRNCIKTLRQARNALIVLDETGLIHAQYSKHLKPVRRDQEGSEFLIWLWDNQYNPKHFERVKITKLEDGSFAEVPLELRQPNSVSGKIFDLDDHKWLAVAQTSQHSPTILNATDSDWFLWRERLEAHGFKIGDPICEEATRERSKNNVRLSFELEARAAKNRP